MLAFLSSVIALRRPRPGERAWAAAPLGMLLLSFALGRLARQAHPLASAATLVLAARNTLLLRGTPRVLQAVGLVSWLTAIFAARALFGR